jgi:hypothetical protein
MRPLHHCALFGWLLWSFICFFMTVKNCSIKENWLKRCICFFSSPNLNLLLLSLLHEWIFYVLIESFNHKGYASRQQSSVIWIKYSLGEVVKREKNERSNKIQKKAPFRHWWHGIPPNEDTLSGIPSTQNSTHVSEIPLARVSHPSWWAIDATDDGAWGGQ